MSRDFLFPRDKVSYLSHKKEVIIMKHSSYGLACCLFVVLGLASGCSASASGGDLSKIVSSKTLVVGTNAEYAPFEYIDSKTMKAAGFDIDFANLIADQIEQDYSIELNVTIKNMDFDSLIGSMNTDQIDFIAAAFSITDERKETLLFSDVYYQAKTVLVVKDSVTSYTSTDDLKNLKIGSQLGTVQSGMAGSYSDSTTSIASLDSLITMLKNDNIDALMVEDAVGSNIVNKNTGLKVIDTLAFDDDGGYGIATNKGNDDLITLINKVITTNTTSGKLDEMFISAVEASSNN